MTRIKKAVVIAAALCVSGAAVSLPSSAYADDTAIRGAACQPGQGVTVVVDSSIDGSDVDIRCAPGGWDTIYAAYEGAGFSLNSDSFVTAIDGVNPSDTYARGWWALYTSTSDGTPAGNPATAWTMANVGASSGPAAIDQAYLFRIGEDYNNYMFDGVPGPFPALSDLGLNMGTTVVPVPPSATHGSADAGLSAAWIAAQLKANGDVLPTTSGTATDWGLTIDAVFALASAGVGGDQLDATAAKLYASGTAYVGEPSAIGTSWPSAAKMILGLEVAGLDPAGFPAGQGTRNLIADLRSVLNPDGSFGDEGTDSIFVHPLAMLALARTDGGVPSQAVTWMEAQQCSDMTKTNAGSYGWSPDCSAPDLDSTAMVIQGLRAAGVPNDDPAIASAVTWLTAQQDASGGFASFGTLNTNTTGLTAQALAGNTILTSKAAQFIGELQVTCDTVSGDMLTPGDVGAISYDQAGFDSALTQGLQGAATGQFLRASVQAVLGLGGPGFGSLSANGATAGLPDLTCSTGNEGGAVTTPSTPAPAPTPAAPSPALPTAPSEVSTGGTSIPQSGGMWLGPLTVLAGLVLLRKATGCR